MRDSTAITSAADAVTLPGEHWWGPLLERMRPHERAALLAAVGLQIVILLMLIAQRLVPLATGETLLLRVVPVDPRDLFRGEYVVLGYDFSTRVPPELAGAQYTNPSDATGRTVYVRLAQEPDGSHWRTEQVTLDKPTSGTFLRGKVVGWNRVECGIESWFVQEGRGREIEQAIRDRQLSAEVAVTADGEAVLKDVKIE
jgi:uncharacterized membrane-anchored protein